MRPLKTFSISAVLVVCLCSPLLAATNTLEAQIPTTSRFSRTLLMNETAAQWLVMLQFGTNSTPPSFQVGTANPPAFFVDDNGIRAASIQSPTNVSLLLNASGGRVGIGTNTPGSTLDVSGTVTASALSLLGSGAQVRFGATNSAPAVTNAPTKWISVLIDGEGTAYRIPLYQ